MSIVAEELHKVDLFADVPLEILETLVKKMDSETYKSDAVLFEQGDAGDKMYFIQSGKIRIYLREKDGNEITYTYYEKNQIFGELSPIDQQPRSASAQAVENTQLLVLDREEFIHLLEIHPQIGLAMMRSLSQRVRNTTNYVEYYNSDFSDEEAAAKVIETSLPKAPAVEEKHYAFEDEEAATEEEYGIFGRMAQSLKVIEAQEE